MLEFKRILVPVDFSRYSEAALRYVVKMARDTAAEVIVLHVNEPILPSTAYVTPLGGYAEGYFSEVESARKVMSGLEPLLGDLPHRMIMRGGLAGDEILASAQEVGADLIVLATHGRSGLSRLLMGSVAETVMRHADAPVMTLRAAWLVPEQPGVTRASRTERV
ncbi:MAG TPA: universal stress protein [Candidatus Xenobia bacterium]|jgi:universal stress protein A